MDEKTARKYRTLGALPSTQQRPRTYRTRQDPLGQLWPRAQARLEVELRLRAKTLFNWLQSEHPGQLTQSPRPKFGVECSAELRVPVVHYDVHCQADLLHVPSEGFGLFTNGYPPDLQEAVTATVLEQAEVLCAEWAS